MLGGEGMTKVEIPNDERMTNVEVRIVIGYFVIRHLTQLVCHEDAVVQSLAERIVVRIAES